MVNINLPEHLPGEKFLIKLVDTFARGMGVAARPWQIRRDAQARAEAKRHRVLMESKTEQDLEDLRDGRLRFNNGKFLPVQGQCEAKGNSVAFEHEDAPVTDILQLAALQARVLEIERTLAIHRIARFAEEQAESNADDANVSDAAVDPDWFIKWRVAAQDARSEDIQRLWARVLCDEVREPGSFSVRTLAALSQFSRADADMVTRLAPFVIDGGIFHRIDKMPFLSGSTNVDVPQPAFDDIAHANAIGLLMGIETGFQRTISSRHSDRYENAVKYHRKIAIFRSTDPAAVVHLQSYPLTPLGREIVPLAHAQPDYTYFRAVAFVIKEQGFAVSISDFVRTSEQTLKLIDTEEI